MKIKLEEMNGGWTIFEWDEVVAAYYNPETNNLVIRFRNTDKEYWMEPAPTGNEDFFNLIKNMNFKWDKSAEVEMFPRMYSPEYYQHGFIESGARHNGLF